MEEFERILREIKEVKIQGANRIAIEGVKAFLLNPTKESAKKIIEARPTEPLLQNAIKLLLKSKDQEHASIKFLKYMKDSEIKTAKLGAGLIKNDMNVFTHCHSTTVMEILKQAKKQGKHFIVYNLEVAPLYQGRTTAKELAEMGIRVMHFPDLAAEQAMKRCDIFLFGADAFLEKGVVNKNGSSILAEIAKHYNIPSFVCGFSMKYTPKIKMEIRKCREFWSIKERNIFVINPAFEIVEKKYIVGVVSELGIFSYDKFIKQAKDNLKEFFK
jgi:translation initiation factor 2B subunit (eIF-2B alpha/beta/delta family)